MKAGNLKLPNDNLDVGVPTAAGEYTLGDAVYLRLLDKLDGHYAEISQDLRSNILDFYADVSLPFSTKTNAGDWARLQKELDYLRAIDTDLRHPVVAAAGVKPSN